MLTNYMLIMFILSMAIVNISIYFLGAVLDHNQTHTTQKTFFYKFGIITQLVAPILMLLLHFFSWKPIEIVKTYAGTFAGNSAGKAHPFTNEFDWFAFLLFFYSAIVGIQLLTILFAYLKTAFNLKNAKVITRNHQNIWTDSIYNGPFCFGAFRPRIFFPTSIVNNWSDEAFIIAITHESHHASHYDPLWKLLSLIVRSILFFVPTAHFLHKKFELEIETFCDFKTLEKTRCGAKKYGSLLLDMMAQMPQAHSLLATTINDSNLKRRIEEMKSRKINRPILNVIMCTVCFAIASVAAAATSGVAKQKPLYEISSEIYVEGKHVASPMVVTMENQPATIVIESDRGDELKIELLVYEQKVPNLKENGIRVDMDFSYKIDGKTIHSKPQIVTLENEEASIEVGDQNGNSSYKMKIVALRI